MMLEYFPLLVGGSYLVAEPPAMLVIEALGEIEAREEVKVTVKMGTNV